MVEAQEDVKNEEIDIDNQLEAEEDDEEDLKTKGDYNIQLVKACQKGDFEQAKKCIEKRANINSEDKKKWTPIVWAACKGHVSVLRLLLSKNAGNQYLPESQDPNILKHVKMGTINLLNRPTPLQWACFKCHVGCVWLLLKAGMSWEDIDSFGNNSVHLAASGGSAHVFETLMMWGVNVNAKNTRGHEPLDLATDKNIIALIKKHTSAKACIKSKKIFTDDVKKHYCRICKNFYCFEEFSIQWAYETKNSNDKEKVDGRCVSCWNRAESNIQLLRNAMGEANHKILLETVELIESRVDEIDIKLLEEAKVLLEKLKTQDSIVAFINNLKVVENYKTILKSVNVINDKVEDAKMRNVEMDAHVLELSRRESERLLAERNLRFQLDNLVPSQAKVEEVKTLEELISIAQEKEVALIYIDEAQVLKNKMAKNIEAKTIAKLFEDYPMRDYPEPIMYDPKTKKPIDPVTKKPIDPKKLPPPPKKKKKEPKFPFPEWSNNGDIKALTDKIAKLNELLKEREYLEIDEEFIKKTQEHIVRMNKEVRFRKQQEEEAKILAEKKAAEKKKK